MNVIEVLWFCGGHGNCGIVRVLDEYDGYKYYIGAFPGEAHGHNEQEDMQWIADWGSSFPKKVGDILFGVSE